MDNNTIKVIDEKIVLLGEAVKLTMGNGYRESEGTSRPRGYSHI